jgi:hypothetical protein
VYPSNHQGYSFYNPLNGKNILSRHVIFDETIFPFQLAPSSSSSPPAPHRLDVLFGVPPPTAPTIGHSFMTPAMNPSTDGPQHTVATSSAAAGEPGETLPRRATSASGRSTAAMAGHPADPLPWPATARHPIVPSPDVVVGPSAATLPRQPARRGASVVPSSDPSNVPTMMTRSSREVHPIKWMNLSAIDSSLAPVPTTYKHAMQDPL